MIILFTAIIIFIFIPLPIKIHAKYFDKKLRMFFFNIDILNKITSNREVFNLDKRSQRSSLTRTLKKFTRLTQLITNIKPKSKIDIFADIRYGTCDAAYTAILYGFINSLFPFLFQIILKIFKLGRHNINITPDFNRAYLEMEINCIIHISFAKLIYVIILITTHESKFRNFKN